MLPLHACAIHGNTLARKDSPARCGEDRRLRAALPWPARGKLPHEHTLQGKAPPCGKSGPGQRLSRLGRGSRPHGGLGTRHAGQGRRPPFPRVTNNVGTRPWKASRAPRDLGVACGDACGGPQWSQRGHYSAGLQICEPTAMDSSSGAGALGQTHTRNSHAHNATRAVEMDASTDGARGQLQASRRVRDPRPCHRRRRRSTPRASEAGQRAVRQRGRAVARARGGPPAATTEEGVQAAAGFCPSHRPRGPQLTPHPAGRRCRC